MRGRNGFTLTELLAVIAIIAILTLMVVPAVIKMYNENVIKAMHIQESEIKEAADLYIEDHCDDPIDHSVICPSSYEEKNADEEKYICLSDLQVKSDKYIDKVKFKSYSCNGIIIYQKDDETNLYTNSNVYLYCGDNSKGDYKYMTDENFNPAKYSRCNIKANNDMYYFQIMEEKLSEIYSLLQNEMELVVQASNETNTSDEIKNIKNSVLKLNKKIDNIYDFEYLNYKILHKDNDLTGKYVVKVINSNKLGLNNLTFSDYKNDIKVVSEAIKDVSYFRSYLSAEQNSLEYRLDYKKCNDNDCKINVVKNIVLRISELAYSMAYGTTNNDDDFISVNLEVQKLFENLDYFSNDMNDNSISKKSIFPNGVDTLTKENSKKVYEDASKYIKNNLNNNLNYTDTWKNQISMYNVINGSLDSISSIVDRQAELINSCITSSLTNGDKNEIDKELASLYNEIENIKKSTLYNTIEVFNDSDYYKDYLIYDLSDLDLKKISCSNGSTSSKTISNYKRKMNLNIISVNANINKANKIIEFVECSKNNCALTSVKDILNIMMSLANDAINASDNVREEYNIQYNVYFKTLNHIAEISKNSNYSVEELGLVNTNILTSSAASSVKTLISNKLSNIK